MFMKTIDMEAQPVPRYHLELFRSMLERLGPLSDSAWQAFSERIGYREFKKDEILIEEGQVEQYIYFILKGAIRVYVTTESKEICTNFRFDNQFASSLTSFLTRRPSQYWLKTQLPTKLLTISHTDLYWLYDNFVEINTLGRVVMEVLLIDKRQRELNFLTLDAESRYQKMVEEHPLYVQKIPLKYVASFLGITAESLSRIRTKTYG